MMLVPTDSRLARQLLGLVIAGAVLALGAAPAMAGDDGDRGGRHAVPGTTSDWIAFTDSGRRFYALLVFGAAVTDSRREQAYRTLDRLRLDPAVRPTWPSSG